MFKLVVLCAFLAAATAEPGVALTSVPVTYSTAGVSPLTTTYSYINPAASVYQPALYSAPYGLPHFIKKRAVPWTYSSYVAPTTYFSSPLATTYSAPYVSAAPYLHSGPVTYTTAAHLIKKRAAVFPTTYVAPTTYATSPFLASTYSTAPVYTTSYVSAAPIYTPHFIKKRAVPVAVSSYVAPTAYSTQTRVDYTAPLVHSYAGVAPIGYAAHFPAPVTHFVK
ncbi:uncharacterized protein [Epargyreus clarus]|uniref:uncharacterized protein n=1 Tax=Epargyreus clarus TaxID=520877 RepID=UPI003C2BC7D0